MTGYEVKIMCFLISIAQHPYSSPSGNMESTKEVSGKQSAMGQSATICSTSGEKVGARWFNRCT